MDEISFFLTNNGVWYVAQLPIGFDDVSMCRYSIFVALGSIAGYGDHAKEIIYCLLEYDPHTDHIYDIWESAVVRMKIPEPDHRAAVLSAICQAIEALIDEARPSVLTMVTYTPNLPAKALTKYQRILQTLAGKGYTVWKTDVWNGSHTWFAER
ncbi:hypothetical protein [Aureimonas sp. SA4125]|uniref:hypothetical protein n=1 Tax=Aureimonas sp. SA4125 TaxID=2826993 RepID=UPI001CC69434|nr:hypothetical protein [Aureimonas sp. SA4125]